MQHFLSWNILIFTTSTLQQSRKSQELEWFEVLCSQTNEVPYFSNMGKGGAFVKVSSFLIEFLLSFHYICVFCSSLTELSYEKTGSSLSSRSLIELSHSSFFSSRCSLLKELSCKCGVQSLRCDNRQWTIYFRSCWAELWQLCGWTAWGECVQFVCVHGCFWKSQFM